MEQKKNNTFSWVLRFATQCKGKMTASVLLAVLGSVCGIVPYFAVSGIVIQICGQTGGYSARGRCSVYRR